MFFPHTQTFQLEDDVDSVSLNMTGYMLGGSTARLLSRSTIFQHPEHPERLLACAGDESAKAVSKHLTKQAVFGFAGDSCLLEKKLL